MPDKLTKTERSLHMSKIRSSNTKPEQKLKKLLKPHGFLYHPKGIYGNPDFANKKKKIIIFVDGCFWHKCPKHYNLPKTNKKYWSFKIKRNIQRDNEVNSHLKSKGWKVIRIWEHQIKVNHLNGLDKYDT